MDGLSLFKILEDNAQDGYNTKEPSTLINIERMFSN
jgi:hypothetical protein